MRLLLDTSALIWFLDPVPRFSTRARAAIRNNRNQILVSAASLWEIAIKHAAGKLSAAPLLERAPELLEQMGFTELPVAISHAVRAGSLPPHHKDPFDRMLVAQAQAEGLAIVSNDSIFDRYGARRIW